MPEVKIAAETREEFGKGAARRSRREGKVPAVLYGHGTETRHLNLPGPVEVPVRISGDIAPGDGMIDQQLVQIPVEAEATNIPRGIDVDVEGMEIGQAVHASDLKLPPGVTLQIEPDTLVLHVIAQQGGEEPEGEEAAEGAPEAPEALARTAEGSGSEEEQAG